MTDASPSRLTDQEPSFSATIAVGRMEFRIEPSLSLSAVQWLEARGLDLEIVDRLGVTSAVGLGRSESEHVAFPTVVRGKTVGWQFRAMDPNAKQRFLGAAEVSSAVWNHDILLDDTLADQPLVITEGRCDAIAAIQAGFPRTISVPGGAPEKEIKNSDALKWLADIEPLVKDCKRIVVATDGDGPGLVLQNEIAKRLSRGRCQYVSWPDGCKDLNQVLLGYGERAVVEMINTASWLHVEGIYLPSTLPPRPQTRQHVSGFPGLDDKYRVRRQDFAVWTGWPGSGKSTALNHFAYCMAENWHWRTCFASFEQPPQTQHMWALRQLRLGVTPTEMAADQIKRADEWIGQHFRFLIPDEDKPTTLDWVFEMFATGIVRYGCDMLCIDPWNEIEHNRAPGQTTTEYIESAIRDMKRFARKWDVHLIVLAHPRKPEFQKRDDELSEPRLDMISDSQHWWNKADVGVVIHPKKHADGYSYTQLRVAKSKYHQDIGKPGVVSLAFNTKTNRYSEIVA